MMRLLRALADLASLLHRQVNSRSKDAQSSKPDRHPDPLRVDIQSELRLPVTEYYASQEHERIHNKCMERFRIIIDESVAVLTAVALAILTWQTLGEIKRQTGAAIDAATAAKISANVANATLVATQRPWVSIDASIDGDWEYAHGADLEVQYRLKNHGTTPAVKVYISNTIVNWNPAEKGLIVEMQQKMCGFGKQEPPMNSKGGYTLFPQQDWIEHTGFEFGKGSVDMLLKRTKVPEGFSNVFLAPFIVGCVTYRTTFDALVHQTPFALMVGTKGSEITTDMHGIRLIKGESLLASFWCFANSPRRRSCCRLKESTTAVRENSTYS
jgi:hypothetical protein